MDVRRPAVIALAIGTTAAALWLWGGGSPTVTSPHAQFGANIGDDYFLASYTQLEAYWQRLARESDRVRLVDIGRTTEGRTQWMALVSSPENLARLDEYRTIARRLALARDVEETEAQRLAARGRAIVWIDGGLHANEILGAQQVIQLVYELASGPDAETRQILDSVIVLAAVGDPDGQERAARWYMRRPPRLRDLSDAPRLAHPVAGHDINRDFFLLSQPETRNIARILYREWFPQIVLDHHQPAPDGAAMFVPPFAGAMAAQTAPPLVDGIARLGAAIQLRLRAEGKTGYVTGADGPYAMDWNGSLRTSAYYHNQVGLLVEIGGEPTPMQIAQVPEAGSAARGASSTMPQRWRFRDAVAYAMAANRAVLARAADDRRGWLLDAYRMARRSVDAAPRTYVIPAGQPDFPTATRLVAALAAGGVTVSQATADFVLDGRAYPGGSWIVDAAQAFRPHIIDMFEPQQRASSAPPPERSDRAPAVDPAHRDPADGMRGIGQSVPPQQDQAGRAVGAVAGHVGVDGAGWSGESGNHVPYDITGWTLAMQMGVRVDRVDHAVAGPFVRVETPMPWPRTIAGPPEGHGFLLSHAENAAFTVVNRLLGAGVPVYWSRDRSVGPEGLGDGDVWIPASARAQALLAHATRTDGVSVTRTADPPHGAALALRPARVAIWESGEDAASGRWIRWVLESHGYHVDAVGGPVLEAGRLAASYDAIVLADASAGRVSAAAVDALLALVRAGGMVVIIGPAVPLAGRMGVADVREPGEIDVPGTILRMDVDTTDPVAYGLSASVDALFDRPFAIEQTPDSLARVVARVAAVDPVRSGWARGVERLAGRPAVLVADVGAGQVVVAMPEIVFRGQAHGTFKLLFNALHLAAAVPVSRLGERLPVVGSNSTVAARNSSPHPRRPRGALADGGTTERASTDK